MSSNKDKQQDNVLYIVATKNFINLTIYVLKRLCKYCFMFDKIFNWAYDQNMKSNHGESCIHKKAYYASGMTLFHVFANHNYVLIYLVGKYVVKTDIYSNMLLSFPVGNYYRSPFVLERSIFSLFAHCIASIYRAQTMLVFLELDT